MPAILHKEYIMKKCFIPTIAIIIVILAYHLIAPPVIDPQHYSPPEPVALDGPLTANRYLQQADLLAMGEVFGPEDTARGPDGFLYSGLENGRIVRIGPDTVESFASTGGRPLGLEFARSGPLAGHLIVADAVRGLLAISFDENIRADNQFTLTDSANGLPFKFTDDLDIAADGTIYFTDASHKYGPDDYLYDLLEARPNGRFLKYNPYTEETSVLLDDLYFANGVALSADESYVLINETYRYRIRRYWLEGEKAGQSEVFIDNLPGFPDNLSLSEDGEKFWVALFTVRNSDIDWLHQRPYLKGLISKLPKIFWPAPEPYGLVLAIEDSSQSSEQSQTTDATGGRILFSLHDPEGTHLKEITSVNEYENTLYLGTLHGDRIGVFDIELLTD